MQGILKKIASPVLAFVADRVARLPESGIKQEVRNLFYQDLVSERIIEYAWILRNIPEGRKRVLDVGCRYSNLVLTLASLGYTTYGVDLEPYPYSHKNLVFTKEDIRRTSFRGSFFDCVTAVSTVEHIGLGFYETTKREKTGDRQAVIEITRILKKGGVLLLTVPYGKWRVTHSYRVYDEPHIKKLLSGLKITKEEYFVKSNGEWQPTTRAQAAKIDSPTQVNSVIFVACRK